MELDFPKLESTILGLGILSLGIGRARPTGTMGADMSAELALDMGGPPPFGCSAGFAFSISAIELRFQGLDFRSR